MAEVAFLGEEDLLALQLGRRWRRGGGPGRAGVEDGEQDYRDEHRQRKADRLFHDLSFQGIDGFQTPRSQHGKTPAATPGRAVRRQRPSYPAGWEEAHLPGMTNPSPRLLGPAARPCKLPPASLLYRLPRGRQKGTGGDTP